MNTTPIPEALQPKRWEFVYLPFSVEPGKRYRRVDGLPSGVLESVEGMRDTYIDNLHRVKYLVGRGITTPETGAYLKREEVINFTSLEVGSLYQTEEGTVYFITQRCPVASVPPTYHGVSTSHNPHERPDSRFFREDGRSVGGKVSLFRKLY